MFGKLWSFMIIFSFIVSGFRGKLSETASAAFDGAGEAVTMCIGLMGIMCFWNGIIKIAEKSGILNALSCALRPLMKFLFRGVEPESKAGKAIIMNISANILGMGNASTPAALAAMQELKKESGGKLTRDMFMFTLLNTVSVQIVPTTVIAMRTAVGAANAAEIILPVWCASACSVAAVIFYAKVLCRKIEI